MVRLTRCVSAVALALGAWAMAPASANAAHEVCYVHVIASDELNTPPGYGVRYSLECNVRLRGYHVTSTRVGMPRDDPNLPNQDYYYPANHDPSFRCDTWYYNNYNGGSPSTEFVCQDFQNYYPYYAGGYWNGTHGAPVCQSPALRWSFDITALDGTKLYGTFPIECGGSTGGVTGGGSGGGGVNVPALDRQTAVSYIRTMIDIKTGRKPRGLRADCSSVARTSIRCRIRFRIRKRGRRLRYRGTATVSNVPESVDPAGWIYRFRGKRRRVGCGKRRCSRRVRWAG